MVAAARTNGISIDRIRHIETICANVMSMNIFLDDIIVESWEELLQRIVVYYFPNGFALTGIYS